ncbi:MAG TPA: hypothetical protein VIU13_03760 [Chryseolinea sp.]
MKTFIFVIVLGFSTLIAQAQSIVGRWQLVKQSNCVESELGEEEAGVKEMTEDMKGLSGAEPQILEFKENNTGEESTKIISKKKSYNSKSFMYRYNEGTLYFLDKKSKTIIDGYTVEKMDGDSLIISNATRVCETKIFVRIK